MSEKKEYVDRAEFLNWLNKRMDEVGTDEESRFYVKQTMTILESYPAADVEPVVRCKDCKRWHPVPDDDGSRFCMRNQMWSAPKFFCAGAERK